MVRGRGVNTSFAGFFIMNKAKRLFTGGQVSELIANFHAVSQTRFYLLNVVKVMRNFAVLHAAHRRCEQSEHPGNEKATD